MWRTLILFMVSLSAAGQQFISLQLEPSVIVPGVTERLVVRVQAIGSPSRVAFEPASQAGKEMELKDDGGGFYSVTLPAEPIVSSMRSDDVYRPFLGYMKLYRGSTLAGRYNIFAEVASAEIPKMPVTSDAPDVQHTDYVVNVLRKEAFPKSSKSSEIPDQAEITRRFYKFFPDDFDVINIIYVPSFFQNRSHFFVRNAVKGIGLAPMDRGAKYGSRSRLQGISLFPLADFFDGAGVGVQHEFAHQWINQLDFPLVRSARPHWPYSTMATGIMGFSIPPSSEGGNFPCQIVADSSGVRLLGTHDQPVFGDLDLYLMGLLPSDQVGEQIVLDSQDRSMSSLCWKGGVYPGSVKRFRIADVIAASGPRVPDAASAQKNFRVATIVVSRDALLSPEAMAFYSYFARRAESREPLSVHEGFVKGVAKPFALSTRGLGTMTSRITPAQSSR